MTMVQIASIMADLVLEIRYSFTQVRYSIQFGLVRANAVNHYRSIYEYKFASYFNPPLGSTLYAVEKKNHQYNSSKIDNLRTSI